MDQALEHEWICDPALKEAKLATDCLREFRYKHNWLNRRVFVQQTPSEQLTQYIETPVSKVISSEKAAQEEKQAEAKPIAMYDYLKIKDAPRAQPAPPLPVSVDLRLWVNVISSPSPNLCLAERGPKATFVVAGPAPAWNTSRGRVGFGHGPEAAREYGPSIITASARGWPIDCQGLSPENSTYRRPVATCQRRATTN